MSWWGTLDAEFSAKDSKAAAELHDYLTRGFSERFHGFPTGSEDGPMVRRDKLEVTAYGRMRDVTDEDDAASTLAWFLQACRLYDWVATATLTVDYDSGPRYRWAYGAGGLTRLRGVLDA